jgi:hypothetical protein
MNLVTADITCAAVAANGRAAALAAIVRETVLANALSAAITLFEACQKHCPIAVSTSLPQHIAARFTEHFVAADAFTAHVRVVFAAYSLATSVAAKVRVGAIAARRHYTRRAMGVAYKSVICYPSI